MKFRFEKPPEKPPEKKPEEEKTRIFKESKELITPDDWEEGMEDLKKYKKEREWGPYIRLAANMKVLYPEANLQADFQIDERTWEELKKRQLLLGKKEKSNPLILLGFARRASSMKILKPEEEVTNEGDWKKMKKTLEHSKKVKDWNYFLELAKNMKLLRPEEELIDQKTWEELKNKRLGKIRRVENWESFARNAMALKILNPEGDLELNEKDWEGVENHLKKEKEIKESVEALHTDEVMEEAAAMKILASKIKFSGVETGRKLEIE